MNILNSWFDDSDTDANVQSKNSPYSSDSDSIVIEYLAQKKFDTSQTKKTPPLPPQKNAYTAPNTPASRGSNTGSNVTKGSVLNTQPKAGMNAVMSAAEKYKAHGLASIKNHIFLYGNPCASALIHDAKNKAFISGIVALVGGILLFIAFIVEVAFLGIVGGLALFVSICICLHYSELKTKIYNSEFILPTLQIAFAAKDFSLENSGRYLDGILGRINLIDINWNSFSKKTQFIGKYQGCNFKFYDLKLEVSKDKSTETVFNGQIYVLPLKYQMPCDLYITERSFRSATQNRYAKKFKTGHEMFDNRFRLEMIPKGKTPKDNLLEILNLFKNMLNPQLLNSFLKLDDLAVADTRMIFSENHLYIIHYTNRRAFDFPDIDWQFATVDEILSYPHTETVKMCKMLDVIIHQTGDLLLRNK